MKKKLIGLIIGIFSFSIVSASSATELKLATFEPPKAFIASKILAGWATKVNQCSAGALNVKMYAGGVLGSPPKQYGTENIGAIRGVATAFGVGASAIGPLIVALGFRATGDYVTLNYFLALIPALAMLASFVIKAPQKSGQ